MCWALGQTRLICLSRFSQGHDTIPLNLNAWGTEGKERQRGRKKAGRGEKKERKEECQIQGRTSWPDDLENHFLFPLKFLVSYKRAPAPVKLPALGLAEAEGPAQAPGPHASCCLGPPPASVPSQGHLGEASMIVMEAEASVRCAHWNVFHLRASPWSSSLDPPRDMWQGLETFLVVSRGCYWHLVGRGQRFCSASVPSQDSPHDLESSCLEISWAGAGTLI